MFSGGFKTREFWLMVFSMIAVTIWPDLPKENFAAIAVWIVGRTGQKAFGFQDEFGKNKWLSSEFLLSIGVGILGVIFPDIPKEAIIGAIGWTTLRTTKKVGEAVRKD